MCCFFRLHARSGDESLRENADALYNVHPLIEIKSRLRRNATLRSAGFVQLSDSRHVARQPGFATRSTGIGASGCAGA